MREFFRGLGKFVQDLLDKIFGKKYKKPQKEVFGTSGYVQMGPGEVYIDGKPFGRVESVTTFSGDEVTSEQWDNIMSLFGDGKTNCVQVDFSAQPEIQKNFFNIPLTLLPKRIEVKTLILTLAANQQSDYQAVDLSQYEERGLANFIVGRTTGLEELMNEYLMEQTYDSEEEEKEEREWLAEELEQAGDSGLFSSVVGKATLLHYEELGVWSFELEDEDE